MPPARFVSRCSPASSRTISSCACRAAQPREREAVADLDALDRLDAHQRRGEPRVEAVVLARVRAEARRNAGRAHLDDAAERVAILARRVDRRPGRRRPPGSAAPRDADPDLARAAPSRRSRRRRAPRCAARDARSSASRTSSCPYFCTPARSAWPGRGSVTAFVPLPSGSPSGGHGLIPHVQFLWSRLRTTSASGVPSVRPCRRPGEHLDLVGLDLLARRAAVALLAPPQVGVDRVLVEHEPGRQAGHDRDERGPVRLAGCGELQGHAGKPSALRITGTGAGTPVQSSNDAAPCATSTSSPSSTRAPAAAAASPSPAAGTADRRASAPPRARRAPRRAPASRSRRGRRPRIGRPLAAARERRARAAARAGTPPPRRRRRSAPALRRQSLRGSPRRVECPSRPTSVFTDGSSAADDPRDRQPCAEP